ncbi:MAG: sulfatase-like hydrolase/transferase, partial [Chloroflexi bacterium]|nr:sulfatase-like hydrolase/transferase [Chloroflexota bacterium]
MGGLALAWAGASALPLACAPSELARQGEAGARPPNILFILADDLGYADLGCYGQTKIRTPNLDRLAREGTRFTQYYSGHPVCAPSRCSLLSGLHTGHTCIRDNREVKEGIFSQGQQAVPEGALALPRLLKACGYATACIGKWGLGGVGTSGDPLAQGFDHFFG